MGGGALCWNLSKKLQVQVGSFSTSTSCPEAHHKSGLHRKFWNYRSIRSLFTASCDCRLEMLLIKSFYIQTGELKLGHAQELTLSPATPCWWEDEKSNWPSSPSPSSTWSPSAPTKAPGLRFSKKNPMLIDDKTIMLRRILTVPRKITKSTHT